MRYLYNEFAKKGKGYTEADYKAVCEKMAGTSFTEFFSNYVYKGSDYKNALIECIDYIGLQLLSTSNKKYYERHYGFKISETLPVQKVITLYPNSVAEKAGIQLGDEIIAINDYSVKNNIGDWAKYFGSNEISLTVSNTGKARTITFTPSAEEYYKIYYVQKTLTPIENQIKNFTLWSRRKF